MSAVLALCAYRMRAFYSGEFDEGVYLVTFQSIARGFAPYRETYLSQPPGFLVATYPLYLAFGATLEGARLAVFSYSLLGLFGLLWLGHELGLSWFGAIAASVLHALPLYARESLTFHGDTLPSTFAIAALAASLRFRRSERGGWLIASASCVTCAVMIKADLSVLPALACVIASWTRADRRSVARVALQASQFALVCAVVASAFILPFDMHGMYENVVGLRARAAQAAGADFGAVFRLLGMEPALIGMLGAAIVLQLGAWLYDKPARFALTVTGLWLITAVLSLLIYRPLLRHHLVFAAVPAAVNVALPFSLWLSRCVRPHVAGLCVVLVVLAALGHRYSTAGRFAPGPASALQQRGIALVRAHSRHDEFIVCDDAIIAGLATRLVPPYLTDLSGIRIKAGAVTRERFEAALLRWKPRLVLAWADRLRKLPDFAAIMQRHKYRLMSGSDKRHRTYRRGR